MMLWRRKTLYVFLITLLVLIFSLIYWNQGGDNNETIKYRIIVFGWRRRASLKRLLDSLEAADYKGRTDIPIEIFLDGEAHNLVVDYVQNFIWTHGQVKIHQRDTRIGLEKVVFVFFMILNNLIVYHKCLGSR